IPEDTFLRFDQCVDVAWIRRGCSKSDTTSRAFRQTISQFLPGAAAVKRTIDAAARAARNHHPGVALHLPHSCVEDHRIAWVHDQRTRAGGVIDVENLSPGLAAISGAKDAALCIRPPGMTNRADENSIRIIRVND